MRMPGKIWVRIRFCCLAVCSLNCYLENVLIFAVVSLIFCEIRVVRRWDFLNQVIQGMSPGSMNTTLNWNHPHVSEDRKENHTQRKHDGVTWISRPWALFFFFYPRGRAPRQNKIKTWNLGFPIVQIRK